MSQTVANLDRKIKVAGDLQTVVRAMKAISAASIGQYEKSIHSLSEYYRTVELGLSLCLREISRKSLSFAPLISKNETRTEKTSVVVFGSDQGLVGQFNDIISEHAINLLKTLPDKPRIWSVGERVHTHLIDAGLQLEGTFPLPNSVKAITLLVGQILIETQKYNIESERDELYLIYNHRTSGSSYEPTSQRLVPLDKMWENNLYKQPWPAKNLPEIMGMVDSTLKVLIREYLFVSIFRTCAESLESENASRLAAMQRADKNIEELIENLKGAFHSLRQGNIDEELFDVISGFEALSKESLTRTSI